MKIEITLPPELVDLIADAVLGKLKPLLAGIRPAPVDAILDVDQLAAFLGVRKQRVYEMVCQSAVPHFHVGRLVRFRRSQIERWIAENSTPAAASPAGRVLR